MNAIILGHSTIRYQHREILATFECVAYGSAAGCAAGLRPAGDDLNTSRGYAPGMGSARQVGQRPNQGHSPKFLRRRRRRGVASAHIRRRSRKPHPESPTVLYSDTVVCECPNSSGAAQPRLVSHIRRRSRYQDFCGKAERL